MTLRFRALNDVGSAMTVTSGIVTRVDAEYVQSEAYVSVENGGVTIDGAPLPEPAVTPWVHPDARSGPDPDAREPTPGATPEPTATASPVAAAPTSQETFRRKALIVIGALVLLAFVLIVFAPCRKAPQARRHGQNRPIIPLKGPFAMAFRQQIPGTASPSASDCRPSPGRCPDHAFQRLLRCARAPQRPRPRRPKRPVNHGSDRHADRHAGAYPHLPAGAEEPLQTSWPR
jgi:hypothetical protein